MHGRDGLVVVVLLAILGAILLTSLSPESPVPHSDAWQIALQRLASGKSDAILLPDHPVTATELMQLEPHVSRLRELDVQVLPPTTGWDLLSRCSQLEVLHWHSPVGDEQLAAVKAWPQLRVLDLPEADLTDEGLRMLAGHSQLQLLRLRSPRVTDAGLAILTELPALRFLHLIEVPVTDAGLPHLQKLAVLESLYLDGDHASEDGLSALIQACPGLHFHRDQTHLPNDPRNVDGHHEFQPSGR